MDMTLRSVKATDIVGFLVASVVGLLFNFIADMIFTDKRYSEMLHGFPRKRWMVSVFIQVVSQLTLFEAHSHNRAEGRVVVSDRGPFVGLLGYYVPCLAWPGHR